MRYRISAYIIKKILIQKRYIIFYLPRSFFCRLHKAQGRRKTSQAGLSGQRSCNKVSPRYRRRHDPRQFCEGFTTNQTNEIMLYRSVRLHIIHVIARGDHKLSRERFGQSFSTSVHHDIGLLYIHLRAAHPPTYSTFMFTHSFTLTCAPLPPFLCFRDLPQ